MGDRSSSFKPSPCGNANVIKMRELFKDKSTNELADGLGCSPSHLTQLLRGSEPTSKMMDLACQNFIRMHGRPVAEGPKLIVAYCAESHWPTIKLLVEGLQGKVSAEFATLLTDAADGKEAVQVVIVSLDQQHVPAVSQLIKSTGGEIKKVLP